MNKGFDSRLDQGWWVLRIGLGVWAVPGGPGQVFRPLNQLARIHQPVGTENTGVQRTDLHAHRGRH